jgi:hypothetical protein
VRASYALSSTQAQVRAKPPAIAITLMHWQLLDTGARACVSTT